MDIFNILAQNIDRGLTLEPPRRDGPNEYPQSMFWIKNKKKICLPLQTRLKLVRSWIKGVYIARTRFPDEPLQAKPTICIPDQVRHKHRSGLEVCTFTCIKFVDNSNVFFFFFFDQVMI